MNSGNEKESIGTIFVPPALKSGVGTIFGVLSEIVDFFLVQFTLRSVHKWLKLFSDAFLTISNFKKNPSKKFVDFACLAL